MSKDYEYTVHYSGKSDEMPVKVLGHTFRRMEKHEYNGFAGADEGSYICCPNDDVILILAPDQSAVYEIPADCSEEKCWTRNDHGYFTE